MDQFKNSSPKEKARYIASITLYPLMWLFAQLSKVCKLFVKKKKQILAVALSFAMILNMLPIMSLRVFASDPAEAAPTATI